MERRCIPPRQPAGPPARAYPFMKSRPGLFLLIGAHLRLFPHLGYALLMCVRRPSHRACAGAVRRHPPSRPVGRSPAFAG